MRRPLSNLATLAALVGAVAVAATAQDADYETPPVLKATDLVDESLLSGPHHRVDAEARNGGFMNHFQIRSDFGDFSAESEELLEIRVRKVAALAKLAEISKTGRLPDLAEGSADLERVYGLGDFELIDFSLEQDDDDDDVVVIRAQEKPWGPTTCTSAFSSRATSTVRTLSGCCSTSP